MHASVPRVWRSFQTRARVAWVAHSRRSLYKERMTQPQAAVPDAQTASSTPLFNIAQYLPAMARSAPSRPAVICSHQKDSRGRTSLTFAELDAESSQCAAGLRDLGITPGMR